MLEEYRYTDACKIEQGLLDSIKSQFKNEPVVITVESTTYRIDNALERLLDARIKDEEVRYHSSKECIDMLKSRLQEKRMKNGI